MDKILDIFKSDQFGVISLSNYINQIKFVPSWIGQRGLFGTPTSVATTVIAIESNADILKLVPVTPRGGPGTTIGKTRRNMRFLGLNHHEINDAVMAEEVQGVRVIGSASQVDTVTRKIVERTNIHNRSFDLTEEYMRLGALRGQVIYPMDDAGNLSAPTLNLFNEMSVIQPDEIAFNLGAAATGGPLRRKCAVVTRQVGDALEGVPFSGVEAICGDAFFDDLIGNEEVRATYLNTEAARELRNAYVQAGASAYGTFMFGGIQWTNYRGLSGWMDTDKCHLYPIGDGIFENFVGPADYVETVNTMGIRLYGRQFEMPNGKGVNLDMQTNQLYICRRPKALIQGKRGA